MGTQEDLSEERLQQLLLLEERIKRQKEYQKTY